MTRKRYLDNIYWESGLSIRYYDLWNKFFHKDGRPISNMFYMFIESNEFLSSIEKNEHYSNSV